MQHDGVVQFKKNLASNIFSCMELSGQSYPEVVNMPVKRFYDYLKWKTDLEDEKQKMIREKTGSGA